MIFLFLGKKCSKFSGVIELGGAWSTNSHNLLEITAERTFMPTSHFSAISNKNTGHSQMYIYSTYSPTFYQIPPVLICEAAAKNNQGQKVFT